MISLDELIAAVVFIRVFTETVGLTIATDGLAVVTDRDGSHLEAARYHAQDGATAEAKVVLEKYCCAAVIALEGFHGRKQGMDPGGRVSNENLNTSFPGVLYVVQHSL